MSPRISMPSLETRARVGIGLLGFYHVALALLLAYLVLELWPPKPGRNDPRGASDGVTANTQAADGQAPKLQGDPSEDKPVKLFGGRIQFTPQLEVRLILLVMVVGALGSYVHAATSFVDYVGNRQFVSSWVLWYLLRPFIGMALALIFYFVARGGFLSMRADASDVNTFFVVAISGLVGMFSKQATDKLNEIFSTLFKTSPGVGDDQRGDKLTEGPEPVVSRTEPQTLTVGATPAAVTVIGEQFVQGAVVLFGQTDRVTKYLDANRLEVTPLDSDLSVANTISVTVRNPGGKTSSTSTALIVQ